MTATQPPTIAVRAHPRLERWAGWAWPVALMGPSLPWLLMNRRVWPWDQAWFGAQTIGLFETLRDRPLAWPVALASATPWKPPAVAWIGQFFVPLGPLLGSVDAALLLSVWACHLIALVLVFSALRELADGRTGVAAAGTLLVGAAPLFIALSTEFLAEAAQTLAVAWFVWLMARAPRWSRGRLAAQLIAATAFAMVAKTTSPLYCAGPGLMVLWTLFRRERPDTRPAVGAARSWPWWILALVLGSAAVAWYGHNFHTVAYHATTAAFGDVAAAYGHRAGFFGGLQEWWRIAWVVLFLPWVAVLVAALLVLAVLRRVRGGAEGGGRGDACARVAAGQVLVTLAVLALSPNRDPRYLSPLLPLVAVVFGWAAQQAGPATWGIASAALILQLALVQAQVYGVWTVRPRFLESAVGMVPELYRLDRDPTPARELEAIVHRTCGHGGFGSDNFVGVDLFRLSGHALTYAAAKERLAGRAGLCHYESSGYLPLEAAAALLKRARYSYWIGVDPLIREIPPRDAFLNRSAPVLFRRLRRQGVLEPEPWDGPPGVTLYRFVN